jgi:ABC-type multidrug transport system fused ATPase/permease subunit
LLLQLGAGKSSLIYALFLLTRLESGKIAIDGVDVTTIALSLLRKKIAIIPQDPVIFSGTLRSNLDPFNEHTDDDVMTCLKHAGLESAIDANAGLNMSVTEGGENWSAGMCDVFASMCLLLRATPVDLSGKSNAQKVENLGSR